MQQYDVTGMSCAACVAHVEKAVSKLNDVEAVNVSLLTNSMRIEGNASPEDVIHAVEQAGYGASLSGAKSTSSTRDESLRDTQTPKLLRRLLYSVWFLAILMYITMGHNMAGLPVPKFLVHNHIGLGIIQLVLALVVMFINRDFFTSGFKSLVRFNPNMDTLVALGSSVSFAWSMYVLLLMTYMQTSGQSADAIMTVYHDKLFFESAAMIPALITVGKTLESYSKGKTTDALKDLMDMSPKEACVLRDGAEVIVPISEVVAGDEFIVKAGDMVPVDGIILEGTASFDESALTGESIYVDKADGDRISCATINMSGYVRARAVAVGDDTAFSQIIRMVEEASATKAPIARVADRVAGVFVPAVIVIAIITFAAHFILGTEFAKSLEYAIAVLVISCPCALGLATPVAIMVANGVGARSGILFKNSSILEMAGNVDIVVLDKTGTITEGKPRVDRVICLDDSVSEDELLRLAYSLESKSEHPLAKAVNEYCADKNIEKSDAYNFKVVAGNGVTASIDGHECIGASFAYISERFSVEGRATQLYDELSKKGNSLLFFSEDERLIGLIAVSDSIKSDSVTAIESLKQLGIEVVMLSGDNENTARHIGDACSIDNVIAGVFPDEKADVITYLQKQGCVAMVGDGINDAVALMRADVGIAIGAGTDVAIDSADIVLMNSRLSDVYAAVRLSRITLRDIYQNLFWAFAYNIILIPLAAGVVPGLSINPMWAAAAMSLSSFTVCMNALRLNLADIHKITSGKHRRVNIKIDLSDYYNSKDSKGESKMTVKINGMMCPHCEARVKEALERIDGIDEAVVSHQEGTAVISGAADVSEEIIKKTITDCGYEFVDIQ